jgi:HK97 family phage major capsid protein
MGPDERKALSVGTDPDGGYVVNPDLSGRIVLKVFESSPMRAYASVQVISSDALEGLFDLNEASSGWVGETDSRPETNTPQLGKWRIPAHELYAKPKATQKLLDDASINMEAWLASKVSEKFARDEANAFVVGNGVNKPRGFLTYSSGTTLPGTIERFDTGVNGAFAAAPNGGDVLINALYGLKQQYRANATWFMNRATLKLTRKLKDSDGAYLWSPGIAAGQPASLLGYPVASFEDMPDPATDSLSIAVGDMREAYQIVDRLGIRTLRDPYSAKPYVEFYTTKRVGGDVVNFEAIKLIEFTA